MNNNRWVYFALATVLLAGAVAFMAYHARPAGNHADPVRIREVLLNLLANAAEHVPEGTVTMSAAARGGAIVIRVRDKGPGIAADELPHLFDRFHKGPHSRGTGLGLSIARRIVVAHGDS